MLTRRQETAPAGAPRTREHVTHSLTRRLLTSWEDRKRKGPGTTTRVLGFGNRLSTLVLEAHPRRVRVKATSSAGFSLPRKEPSEATAATLTSDRLPFPSGGFSSKGKREC